MPRYALLITTSLATALAVACRSPNEVDYEFRLATIVFEGEGPTVSVPDTVTVGGKFLVAVQTYGGGCVGYGRTDTKVRGAQAEILPYSKVALVGSGWACTSELRFIPHAATITFIEPGRATVRFRGMREFGADTVVVDVPVYVRTPT